MESSVGQNCQLGWTSVTDSQMQRTAELNLFTGWKDPELTEKGKQEALKAAQELKAHGHEKFDVAYTSNLTRAHQTLDIIVKNLGLEGIETHKDQVRPFALVRSGLARSIHRALLQALNERDYGDLVGLNKDDARKKWGEEQVHIWRRSYDTPPPNGESLKMTAERSIPYFLKVTDSTYMSISLWPVSGPGGRWCSIFRFVPSRRSSPESSRGRESSWQLTATACVQSSKSSRACPVKTLSSTSAFRSQPRASADRAAAATSVEIATGVPIAYKLDSMYFPFLPRQHVADDSHRGRQGRREGCVRAHHCIEYRSTRVGLGKGLSIHKRFIYDTYRESRQAKGKKKHQVNAKRRNAPSPS
jgi:bisphosphoglycerate-dependent phosphoglycerate mutase